MSWISGWRSIYTSAQYIGVAWASGYWRRKIKLTKNVLYRFCCLVWQKAVSYITDTEILIRAANNELGGFACYPGHDDHITNTVYAVQVLAMLDSLHVIDKDKVASCKFLCICTCDP